MDNQRKGVAKLVDDIPDPNRRKYDWAHISRILRDNPGKWGIIEPIEGEVSKAQAYALVSNLNSGRIRRFKQGEIEATSRGTTVYVRYIGKDAIGH